MKKPIKLPAIALTMIVMALAFQMCNKNYYKDNAPGQTVNNCDNDRSDAMTAHILAFKQRMEYFRDNPGLKSDEKEQVDTTVLDWEATINLTYCYSYLDLSDSRVYDTTLALPPVSQDSILMSDISDKYYNEIVYAVQAQYFRAPFPDSVKKLMVVDMEKTTGGDSLHIKSLIGNTTAFATPEYDWMYGNYLGTCDSLHFAGISDAAHEIAKNTRNHFKVDPPTGCRWYFTHIDTITVNDPTVYPNPSDPPPTNYEDYLVYYANSAIDTIKHDVLCLENSDENDEFAFYKQSYIDLTQGWIDNSGGKKFQNCNYVGIYTSNIQGDDIYKHELLTTIGYRFITCSIEIEDISQY